MDYFRVLDLGVTEAFELLEWFAKRYERDIKAAFPVQPK